MEPLNEGQGKTETINTKANEAGGKRWGTQLEQIRDNETQELQKKKRK